MTLAVALALAGSAKARIGDNAAEIRNRYGEPIALLKSKTRDPGAVKCYCWKGYIIAVTYVGGQSVREIFTKQNNSRITDPEIETALETNAGGLKWQAQAIVSPNGASAGVREWRTSDDGSRIAFYDTQTRALFISTQRFVDLVKATQRQITLGHSSTGAGAKGSRALGEAGAGALRNTSTILDKGAILSQPNKSKPSASPGN